VKTGSVSVKGLADRQSNQVRDLQLGFSRTPSARRVIRCGRWRVDLRPEDLDARDQAALLWRSTACCKAREVWTCMRAASTRADADNACA
jgi:hypothetical protein